MKILLRLPTWLGDCVMSTATIEILKAHYSDAEFSIVGSKASCEVLKRDPRIKQIYIDESKNSSNRYLYLYKLAKKIGRHDIAITFQNNLPSALLLFFTKTPITIGYRANFRGLLLSHPIKQISNIHQVQKYANLLNPLNIPIKNLKLKLCTQKKSTSNTKKIGLNTGAKYGSAKRWLQEYFIELGAMLIDIGYEVVLYGTEEERESNEKIQSLIKSLKNKEITNLTGKTTISELVDSIANLDLLITNDSGSMHIASALNTPIVAIFGPTDQSETSPWNDAPYKIISKNLDCAPCKKRVCPLGHHNCMRLIFPEEVLEEVMEILQGDKNANRI